MLTTTRIIGALLLLAFQGAAEPVTLVWATPDHFWYRKAVSGGHVWVTVDAVYAVREPLFDHQRLATELNLRSGMEFTALTLPFADPALRFVVKYDGTTENVQERTRAIEFVLDGQDWRCELQVEWDWGKAPPTDYECQPRGPASAASLLPDAAPAVRSPDGKWEALVQNDNVVVRAAGSDVAGKPLSADGTPTFAYQAGSILWSADSRSVTAWRVDQRIWQSNSMTGTVKGLVAKSTWRVATGARGL